MRATAIPWYMVDYKPEHCGLRDYTYALYAEKSLCVDWSPGIYLQYVLFLNYRM